MSVLEPSSDAPSMRAGVCERWSGSTKKGVDAAKKYLLFVGPGFMVSVAYIDPGNYATDAAAGASYRFQLLFVVLVSNVFAIYLQSLAVKLGTVSGLNLAECCRKFMPSWLNLLLYVFAEAAIIATDLAEVIGSAIALNLLFNIPIVAGCALTILDVIVILVFYRPTGSMRGVRFFEAFVALLVVGVVVCFIVQLCYTDNAPVAEVFRGYLPSSAIIESKGLYQACGILGATVMPHSLYLGSGIVQPRLYASDLKNAQFPAERTASSSDSPPPYRPSIVAIMHCLTYSTVEVALSLFTFALFVNSAILIVAGASMSNDPDAQGADLFELHELLSSQVAPVAGTIFALALLLSGTSAGIVCTIAGQMVSEGQLNWTIAPWMRRLITRCISITPSIIIAGVLGREGLNKALTASQVVLSVILPFVTAPLIYFTSKERFMTVPVSELDANSLNEAGVLTTNDEGAKSYCTGKKIVLREKLWEGETGEAAMKKEVVMKNGRVTATLAALIWGVISSMNVALLVLLSLGKV